MEKIIKAFLGAYFLVFPFGQLTRLPLPQGILPPEVNLYLTDLILILLLLAWLGGRFFLSQRPYQRPPLAGPIALFALLAFFSLLINTGRLAGNEMLVSGLYLLRWLLFAGLYFVISDLKWRGRPFLVWAGLTTALLGLIQYWFWPDIRPLQIDGWDPHYFRVVGTLLDPGLTGLILVLGLILLAMGHWKHRYFLFAILYAALALTYSRSSYLAYLSGMSALAFLKKSPRFFLAVIAVGIFTLAILPQNDGDNGGEGINLKRQSTINARLTNWRQSGKIIADHPFFGVGFNAYRYAQRDDGFLGADWQTTHAGAGADSSFLFVWATTGVFGLFAYLWLWWRAGSRGSGLIKVSLTAVLVHAFFLNSLFYPWVMGWLWTLLATESR